MVLAGGFARISGVLHDVLEKTCVCNERTRKVMLNDFERDPRSVETVDHRRFDPDTVEPGQTRRNWIWGRISQWCSSPAG